MQTDHELLRQYTQDGCEDAFAELVRRHTDLVYAACLRIVRDPHLAEDAAQAAFLVLVRRARTIAAGESLAGWLYRVAVNSARNAQRMAARRKQHERQAGEAAMKTVDAAPQPHWENVAPFVDAALDALPRAQRDAIVARCLQGQTQAQAAVALNCPPETVHTRVNRGLEKLRALLARRNVRLSAAALALLLEKSAHPPAPPALVSSIQAACLGKTAVSLTASTLAMEVAKSMSWIKPLFAAACAGCAALLLAGIFIFRSVPNTNPNLVAQPRLTRPAADPVTGQQHATAPASAPAPAQAVQAVQAQPAANPKDFTVLMSAIDSGLAWLERAQEPDGHYDSVKYGGAAGQDVAVTSMATLSMLGAGHTRKVGQFKPAVEKSIQWLERQPAPGDITQAALRVMALAESAGMSRKGISEAQAATDDLITRQNLTGEWIDENGKGEYERTIAPTTWAVMALKSARVAGIKFDIAALENAIASFDLQQREVLANEDNVAGVKMAAGLAVQRQFTGANKADPSTRQLVALLPRQQPRFPSDGLGHEVVFWFQASLALFQQGGNEWNTWSGSLREALLPSQVKDGDLQGSWDFRQGSDPFRWGRVGATALAALPLEVEARYLMLQPASEIPVKHIVIVQSGQTDPADQTDQPKQDDAGF